jgi:hypothetical protein
LGDNVIASISKQLVVVIAIVGAALPALVSAELVGERKFYFDGTYSVSDCPRPQVRQTIINSTFGTRKTSACGEYLNKEFLNIIWRQAIDYSKKSVEMCGQIEGAVHKPSWYQFRCFITVRGFTKESAYNGCEMANGRPVTPDEGFVWLRECYK